MEETWVQSLGWENPLEKGMATHSSILTQRIPLTVQSMGSQVASQVALVVKNLPANAGDIETQLQSLGREDPQEEEMATHSSILVWENPWTEEPGGLQSLGCKELDKTEHTVHRKQLPVTTGIIIDTIIITIDKPKNHNSISVQKRRLETDLEGPFHSKTFFFVPKTLSRRKTVKMF